MENSVSYKHEKQQEDMIMRRGPWTAEEDITLIRCISVRGEGRWNTLAKCAGLKRNGKSCRLRWLNYLSPGVKRGNITPEERHLILELHGRWGNRWSKIARYLPGRTDNEIKNYWRTKIKKAQPQYKAINCYSSTTTTSINGGNTVEIQEQSVAWLHNKESISNYVEQGEAAQWASNSDTPNVITIEEVMGMASGSAPAPATAAAPRSCMSNSSNTNNSSSIQFDDVEIDWPYMMNIDEYSLWHTTDEIISDTFW